MWTGAHLLEFLAWVCVGLQVYHYVGYPLLLWLLTKVASRPVASAPVIPPVSLIISGYNEEAVIERKLGNSLALDYPALEIIVNSEGSDDATAAIVGRFAERVISLHGPTRQGKA